MPALVIGDPFPILAGERDVTLAAEHHLLERILKVVHGDLLVGASRGHDGRLVDLVPEIGSN